MGWPLTGADLGGEDKNSLIFSVARSLKSSESYEPRGFSTLVMRASGELRLTLLPASELFGSIVGTNSPHCKPISGAKVLSGGNS